jgi:hypothetical protein
MEGVCAWLCPILALVPGSRGIRRDTAPASTEVYSLMVLYAGSSDTCIRTVCLEGMEDVMAEGEPGEELRCQDVRAGRDSYVAGRDLTVNFPYMPSTEQTWLDQWLAELPRRIPRCILGPSWGPDRPAWIRSTAIDDGVLLPSKGNNR